MEISIQMHESLFWDIDSNLHKCIFLGPMFYIKSTMENNSILKNMEWKYLVWYNKKCLPLEWRFNTVQMKALEFIGPNSWGSTF